MNIQKNAALEAGTAAEEKDLAEINRLSKRTLGAEEVFIFPLRLCDNEVDRDFERFPTASLEKLAQLFPGTTGIFDHQWTAAGQKARLFRAELQRDEFTKNSLGEDYVALKGWAYMLRTPENGALIAEIEGGIKKEISIGCAVAETRCSICGKPLGQAGCSHRKGERYGGKLCVGELWEPTDAYEWSFVAVPAQRQAGITKAFEKGGRTTIKRFLQEQGGESLLPELEDLEIQAEMGRRYMKSLRQEVVRLGLMAEDKLEAETLEAAAEKLSEAELLSFKKAFSSRVDELYPGAVQLGGAQKETKSDVIRAYLV